MRLGAGPMYQNRRHWEISPGKTTIMTQLMLGECSDDVQLRIVADSDAPDAQRMARWRAAAPVSNTPSDDVRLSLPISTRNGCMTAESPVCTSIGMPGRDKERIETAS